jgi:CheY-like chemotaxis protein
MEAAGRRQPLTLVSKRAKRPFDPSGRQECHFQGGSLPPERKHVAPWQGSILTLAYCIGSLAPSSPAAMAFARTASLLRGGTDRLEKPSVLIVEHESLIRLNIVHVAQDAGYQVLEAANADEVTEILEGSHNIEMVFTTVRMLGSMDGLALASAIRSRWPSIRVIVTSGRDLEGDPNFPVDCVFIQKPYENGRIAEELRRLLIPQ